MCNVSGKHDTATGLVLVLHHSQDSGQRREGRVDGHVHGILLWTVRYRVERMEAGEGCLVHNLPSPLASTAGRIAQSGGKRDAELGIGRSRKTEEGGKDGSPTRHLPLRNGMKKEHQHLQACSRLIIGMGSSHVGQGHGGAACGLGCCCAVVEEGSGGETLGWQIGQMVNAWSMMDRLRTGIAPWRLGRTQVFSPADIMKPGRQKRPLASRRFQRKRVYAS